MLIYIEIISLKTNLCNWLRTKKLENLQKNLTKMSKTEFFCQKISNQQKKQWCLQAKNMMKFETKTHCLLFLLKK